MWEEVLAGERVISLEETCVWTLVLETPNETVFMGLLSCECTSRVTGMRLSGLLTFRGLRGA